MSRRPPPADTARFDALLETIQDFPKEGIAFKDISPLLLQAFGDFIDTMSARVADWGAIDHVAGLEARGFPFAAALAYKHAKGFLMLRKAGKLPPPTVQQAYDLEYGKAVLECKRGEGRVLIVDDVLATGGSMTASLQLIEAAGYTPVSTLAASRLSFLKQTLPTHVPHDWILDI